MRGRVSSARPRSAMRHVVGAASGDLAAMAAAAGLGERLDDLQDGGVVLAGDEAWRPGLPAGVRRARWLDRDPAGALDLPLPAIASADWIAELLGRLRPDAPVFVVRPGLEASERARRNPSAGPLRVSGPPEILAAMTQPHERVDDDPDVILDLAPTPRRSVPSATPVVGSLVPGREELVEHGVSGLLTEPDDPRGAARLLDLLAADAALLARLCEGAAAAAEGWPSVEDAGRALVEALDAIAALPPASDDPGTAKPLLSWTR